MRSRSVALLVAVVFALAGCARVDLTNEWPSQGAPTGWEPKPGVCTHAFALASARYAYQPTECAGAHIYETVHIGQFKGEAAALAAPPAVGSAALNAAWAECADKASEYLGGPWHLGRIWIGVSVPIRDAWESDARWFRCEAAVSGIVAKTTTWSKSLKGEFASSEALLKTCVQLFDDDRATQLKDCAEQHNGELVGTYLADDYKVLEDNSDSVHRKCRSLVAAYVGVPDDRNIEYRTGTSYIYPTTRDWAAGDRQVQCFLYLSDEKLTKSLKGGGSKALPVG